MPRAWLANQYPKPSHAFVRREIRALEASGVAVHRFSVRRSLDPLVDPGDQEEARRTRVILEAPWAAMVRAVVATLAGRPRAFAAALARCLAVAWRSDRGLVVHLAYLIEACLLARWLRAAGCEHLHAHFATNSTTVAMLSHLLGGPPFSFTAHGPEPFDKPAAIALGEKLERAAFAVAVSQFGASQLRRWASRDARERIHVVRCGVDAEFLESEPSPVPDTQRLLFIGRLCVDKAPDLLLEAAARLVAEGRSFELEIGGDGPLRPALEAEAQRLGLAGRTRFRGWLREDEVRSAIDEARGLILPSLAEGLPVVIMEAFARGRPVVASRIAGIPELVEPGVSGWLIVPGCASALAGALGELLDAPVDQLTAMGRAGREAVLARPRAEAGAARLGSLIEAAVRRAP